ncbi:MAG: hypothetical protein ACO3DT_04530 [Gammaproteobacteria bacterium]
MKQAAYQAVSSPIDERFCTGFDAISVEANVALDDATATDSLFENFVDEIDAWARQALAVNGFGDYL